MPPAPETFKQKLERELKTSFDNLRKRYRAELEGAAYKTYSSATKDAMAEDLAQLAKRRQKN